MHINLRQIEAFYWAARLGSLVAAAKRLNTTQSTISMRISKMEQQFGVRLFDRSHRTARLTLIGHELIPYASKLIGTSAEIAEVLVAPASLSGQLRIGVSETISMTWLPKFIRTVHERYPKIVLNTDVDLAIAVINRLEKGLVDFTLGPGDIPRSRFRKKSLGVVDRKWIASPSLGLPDRRLTPDDLDGMPVIALSKTSAQQASVEHWFRSNGIRYRSIDTCNSSKVALDLAIAGLGISLLPIQYYEKDVVAGTLRILDVEPAVEPIEYFAMLPADEQKSLIDHITDIAVEVSDFTKLEGHLRVGGRKSSRSATDSAAASAPFPAGIVGAAVPSDS